MAFGRGFGPDLGSSNGLALGSMWRAQGLPWPRKVEGAHYAVKHAAGVNVGVVVFIGDRFVHTIHHSQLLMRVLELLHR